MKHYPRGFPSMRFQVLAFVGIVLAVVALMLLFIVIAYGADVAPTCMTKEQARAKYPKQWIYWHGINRCWDNVPVRRSARPARVQLAQVQWHPRPFEGSAFGPPVVLTVVAYRWPGSHVIDAPVVVLDPITFTGAAEFNELDEGADK